MSSHATQSIDGTARTDEVLRLENVTKRFGGVVAVDDLSFSVREEEILGFIGPNGAGKSTTFNCVSGAFPPTDGAIYYRDEDVTGVPQYALVEKGLARTYQTFRPLEDRSVLENVSLSMVPNELFSFDEFRTTVEDRAREICQQVGLSEHMHQTPDELPHAGLLRLEVGRAIGTEPDLLLVDEPFAGLTPEEVERTAALFRSLREDGMTLIVIDHNMHGLLDLVDRVVVISFGEKIAEGSPEEIRNDPTVQEAYLGGEL
ncbi:ABC transporter ATP-binding protein [Halostagnicola kamekurae]|uniref:Amino acid/amide ABC transporter ATP-binding protein 1, HAAT family n=1 Tax=Halostagnicola kamekurae TaxID=619731 RepID=A0A1I6P960_9EURY|nr:ABC transporter ATP-binding protein [Halostagnicola kamekurae]SFS36752.1 amino acid/amide ABC transporter ATP-binding protein 1, HAAT family [Halostagnicola kamekurae]